MKKFMLLVMLILVLVVSAIYAEEQPTEVIFEDETVVEDETIKYPDEISIMKVKLIDINTDEVTKIDLFIPAKDLGETTVLEQFDEDQLDLLDTILDTRMEYFMDYYSDYFVIDLRYVQYDLNENFLGYYEVIVMVEKY